MSMSRLSILSAQLKVGSRRATPSHFYKFDGQETAAASIIFAFLLMSQIYSTLYWLSHIEESHHSSIVIEIKRKGSLDSYPAMSRGRDPPGQSSHSSAFIDCRVSIQCFLSLPVLKWSLLQSHVPDRLQYSKKHVYRFVQLNSQRCKVGCQHGRCTPNLHLNLNVLRDA